MVVISSQFNKFNYAGLHQLSRGTVNKTQNLSFRSNIDLKPVSQLVGNHPHPVKIVFADVDDTLQYRIGNDDTRILPDENKAAIKKLEAQNVKVVLASGRNYKELTPIVKRCDMKNAYIIGEQGCRVTDPNGKDIYVDELSPKETKDILSYCRENILKKAYESDTTELKPELILKKDGDLFVEQPSKIVKDQEMNQVNGTFEQHFGEDLTPTSVNVVEKNPEKLKAHIANLKQEFDGRFNVEKTSSRRCEVLSSKASKFNAIKVLCARLNIPLKNIAVIGDGDNDANMMLKAKEAGGLAVAMGNSSEKLKANAEYISGDVKDAGFGEAMEHIIENNDRLKKAKV